MKVLLFCPTARLEPETLDSIFRLDPAGHKLHILFTRHNPARTGSYNILFNYRQGRKAMLDGDYDAMLTVESDMIIPSYALRKLALVDADIALGLYVHRHWEDVNFSPFNAQPFPMSDNPLAPLFLSDDKQSWPLLWGQTVRVSGSGLGCALIHRRVLEAIQFQIFTFGGKWIPADCDTFFHADALDKGFTIKCDTSVVCGHKRPDHVILWPTQHGAPYFETGDSSPAYHLGAYQNGTTYQ